LYIEVNQNENLCKNLEVKCLKKGVQVIFARVSFGID